MVRLSFLVVLSLALSSQAFATKAYSDKDGRRYEFDSFSGSDLWGTKGSPIKARGILYLSKNASKENKFPLAIIIPGLGGQRGRDNRMCDLVGKMNGRLIHHDGGGGDSLAKLQGAISSADAVIFPVDCVSHSSALEAKKLCKKMLKPFMPIRSSSLSSLVTGLAEFKFDDNNLNVKQEESNKP